MPVYDQCIAWTTRGGGSQSVTVNGYDTADEAFNAAMQAAIRTGWTPPKWWQWWRRFDQPRTAVPPSER